MALKSITCVHWTAAWCEPEYREISDNIIRNACVSWTLVEDTRIPTGKKNSMQNFLWHLWCVVYSNGPGSKLRKVVCVGVMWDYRKIIRLNGVDHYLLNGKRMRVRKKRCANSLNPRPIKVVHLIIYEHWVFRLVSIDNQSLCFGFNKHTCFANMQLNRAFYMIWILKL